MKYNLAVCGGTFDHLHKGHREFLRYGLSITRKLLIGLTTERYVKAKSGGDEIESYKLRKQQVEKFLHEENAIDRVLIAPIDDIFVPKVWEKLPIEAIIVSKDSILGAEKINFRRKEQGKYPLKIETFPLVKSEDNEYISSSRIRNGEINREGMPYINPLWLSHKLFITEQVRTYVKRPFGKLLQNNVILVSEAKSDLAKPHPESPPHPNPLPKGEGRGEGGSARMTQSPYLITVGDVTTKTFNDLSLSQNISVIDFKVSRKKVFSSLAELGFSGRDKIVKTANPAGCLTPALFRAASEVFKFKKNNRRIIIQIDGEEDLSVLPLALSAPLRSLIFYGQPGEGIVKVEVSEETKMRAYYLVSSFEVSS